ncbi:efflux transporter outer membrane subunit [Pseudomonas xanthosomatis]|uniref:efflux transporter outer membrane subunit n=1 Tax=Pseudomonas xanthosomatis TaxID=2842356 RepID=UPI00351434B4
MPRKPELLLLAALISGCSLAPQYSAPIVDLPAQYFEPGWQSASPTDPTKAIDWGLFNDATLSDLQALLIQRNPDLHAALAHYQAATAYAAGVSGLSAPQVDASMATLRQRQSDNRPLRGSSQPSVYNSNTLGVAGSLDLDLWGRLRNEASMAQAQADASAGDLREAQRSLQTQLAIHYLRLRGMDAQSKILHETIDSYGQALKLVESRYRGAIASELDLVRAKHQLADAKAQLDETLGQRAVEHHKVAALVGSTVEQLNLTLPDLQPELPHIPKTLPSALLQQRPDISAAERRVYAANRGIGVARAAMYPDIGLTASIGGQTTGSGNLLAASNRYWALGPLIHLPIFEGGRLQAQEDQKVAEFDEASARYRSTVLNAIREVEDNLAMLNHLEQQASDENDALGAAQRATALATQRYKEGAISYLEVLTAQTLDLEAQRKLQKVQTNQMIHSARLIGAVGGQWGS